MNTRRHFLQSAALGAASLALGSKAQAAAKGKHTLCAFTKHLQGLPYDQIADIAAEVGLITPPVGMNLFVLQGISKGVPIRTIALGAAPFMLAMPRILH